MGFLWEFGLGLGLSGAAGVRGYFPLLVIGLISRFSEILTYRPPFKLFSSVPFLLLLLALAAYETANERIPEGHTLILAVLRTLSGAIIFAGLFEGLGIIGGLMFGGLVSVLSFLLMIRLTNGYKLWKIPAGLEETIAAASTLLTVLFPWTSFLFWGTLSFLFLKRDRGIAVRNNSVRTRPWR